MKSGIVNNQLKVAVLAGGIGGERQISLQSGKCVYQALKGVSVDAILSDIAPDNLQILDKKGIDVFFLAMHGQFGEDGQLQQILEDRGLVYTGSGPEASRLAFDKWKSKKAFVGVGVKSPQAILFNETVNVVELVERLSSPQNKYVIKPLTQGSTIGISIVEGAENAITCANNCLDEFGNCMIERFICGREITVGILCDGPLPIIEIQTQTGFYDYHAKYKDEKTKYLFDTIEDKELTAKIQTAAMDCFNALGCSGFGRVDFILTDRSQPYVLETNTIPGLTSHSLLPKAAAKAGLSMSELCIKVIKQALKNQNKTANSR